MLVVMLAGRAIVGACVSLTVTVKLHVASGVMPFVAVQLTVVVPFGNVLPEGGVQVTVGVGQPAVAVGAAYVTTAEHWFGSVLVAMLAGQALRVGG